MGMIAPALTSTCAASMVLDLLNRRSVYIGRFALSRYTDAYFPGQRPSECECAPSPDARGDRCSIRNTSRSLAGKHQRALGPSLRRCRVTSAILPDNRLVFLEYNPLLDYPGEIDRGRPDSTTKEVLKLPSVNRVTSDTRRFAAWGRTAAPLTVRKFAAYSTCRIRRSNALGKKADSVGFVTRLRLGDSVNDGLSHHAPILRQ